MCDFGLTIVYIRFFCEFCYMNQENQNIEHKRIWKDEYLKWVSGFANAHGGKIYKS